MFDFYLNYSLKPFLIVECMETTNINVISIFPYRCQGLVLFVYLSLFSA